MNLSIFQSGQNKNVFIILREKWSDAVSCEIMYMTLNGCNNSVCYYFGIFISNDLNDLIIIYWKSWSEWPISFNTLYLIINKVPSFDVYSCMYRHINQTNKIVGLIQDDKTDH
jgi:hypothetical protein